MCVCIYIYIYIYYIYIYIYTPVDIYIYIYIYTCIYPVGRMLRLLVGVVGIIVRLSLGGTTCLTLLV